MRKRIIYLIRGLILCLPAYNLKNAELNRIYVI